MANFAFLVDISSHLATVNLKLQQRGQLIHVRFSNVKTFQVKLKRFEQQLDNDLSHFPVMAKKVLGSHELQRKPTELC